jgi:hypothetical protein
MRAPLRCRLSLGPVPGGKNRELVKNFTNFLAIEFLHPLIGLSLNPRQFTSAHFAGAATRRFL